MYQFCISCLCCLFKFLHRGELFTIILCFITCEPCVCGQYTCHVCSLISVYNDVVVPLLKNYPDALYFCDHRGTSVSQLLSMLNRHLLSAEESDSDSSDSEVMSNSFSRSTDFAVSVCVCMRPSELDPSNHEAQCACSQWRSYRFLTAARQRRKQDVQRNCCALMQIKMHRGTGWN